jgi:hypothetical protein
MPVFRRKQSDRLAATIELAAADVDVALGRLAERDDARIQAVDERAEGQEIQRAFLRNVQPPDFTRFHSHAGPVTKLIYDYYGDRFDGRSARAGHAYADDAGANRRNVRRRAAGSCSASTTGARASPPSAKCRGICKAGVGRRGGFPWPAQLANLIWTGKHDLILSVGQVVPHEVVGMANYNKNIFVGTGGVEGINRSHFIGAAYGMEKMMGRADTPVRRILNYASEHFTKHLPIVYVHTVVGRADDGRLVRARPCTSATMFPALTRRRRSR